MGLITDLQPLNLEEEKKKFFNSETYNPQFIYKRNFTKKELTIWGKPKERLFKLSLKLTKKNGAQNNRDIKPLPKKYIIKEIKSICKHYQIVCPKIKFIPNHHASASTSENKIFFRYPVKLNKERFKAKLNHELQTHFLRRINDQKFNWNRTKRDDVLFKFTEEGLASLHSYVFTKNKLMKKTLTNYIAMYYGFNLSFRETFKRLKDLGVNNELAWTITLKKKRGLNDTSLPGGFTKDITYFEGAIKVWQWLQYNNPAYLYLGRLDLNYIDHLKQNLKIKQIIKSKKLLLPTFLKNITAYKDEIKHISNVNHFSQLV